MEFKIEFEEIVGCPKEEGQYMVRYYYDNKLSLLTVKRIFPTGNGSSYLAIAEYHGLHVLQLHCKWFKLKEQ